MTAAVKTHIGLVRNENQDCVKMKNFGDDILVVVCDGMGGENSGKKASNLAIQIFTEYFTEKQKEKEEKGSKLNEREIRECLIAGIAAANSVIYTTAKLEYKDYGMGTTCVAAYISDESVSIVNVGDSRAYIYTDAISHLVQDEILMRMLARHEEYRIDAPEGATEEEEKEAKSEYYKFKRTIEKEVEEAPENHKFFPITKDHTLVQVLRDEGQIEKEEMATHPQRHVLVRAVGVAAAAEPDFFRFPRNKDQQIRILLCSDGLSGYCSDAEIEEIIKISDRSAEEIADALVGLALSKGGRDNVSVAVVMEENETEEEANGV